MLYGAAFLILCLVSISCVRLTRSDQPASPIAQKPNDFRITDVSSSLSRAESPSWIVHLARVSRLGEEFEQTASAGEKLLWIASKKQLLRSHDGGHSWRQISLKIPPQAAITGIYFVNPNVGWSIIEKEMPRSDYAEGGIWIYRTRDGGRSWILSYQAKAVSIGRLNFFDETYGWLTGQRYVGVTPQRSTLFVAHTEDQGEHWLDISDKLNDISGESTSNVNDWISKIISTDTGVVTLLTARGRVFRTADNGSWEQIFDTQCKSPQACVCDFGMKGERLLWIAGGNYGDEGVRSILLTEDDTGDWIRYNFSGVDFLSVLQVGKAGFLAAGTRPIDKTGKDLRRREGVILYSANGGKDWEIVYHNDEFDSIKGLIAIDGEVLAVGGRYVIRLQRKHP